MTIGERLKLIRLSKNLSQKEVAEKLDVSRSTYNKWESGASNPTRMLPQLADLFGVSTDYILGTNQPTEVFLLSEAEKECLDKFKQLTGENQIKILGMIDLVLANQLGKAAI